MAEINPFSLEADWECFRKEIQAKAAGQFVSWVPEAVIIYLYFRENIAEGREADEGAALWRKLMTAQDMGYVWKKLVSLDDRPRGLTIWDEVISLDTPGPLVTPA
jgi:hypothetical protein